MLDIDRIQEIVEASVKVALLQPQQAAQLKARGKSCKGISQNPVGWLVICADGRKFKAYEADESNRYRLDLYTRNCQILKDESFVPDLVAYAPGFLLVEYVDGSFPDMKEPRFAAALGQVLARLHGVGEGMLPSRSLFEGVAYYWEHLVKWEIFTEGQVASLRKALESCAPARFRTSIVYADIKPENYCWNEQGELTLFDLGSFQQGRITDSFLLGSTAFEIVDRDTFLSAYVAEGGVSNWLDYEKCLRGLNSVEMLWYFTAQLKKLPLWAFKRRRAHKGWIKDLQSRIKREFVL